MPVTIKLSRTLSDRLGEEAAQELVEWFNQMDAASTRTIRELNELNFARFDAKLELRLSEFRVEMMQNFAELRQELKAELSGTRTDFNDLKTDFSSLKTDFGNLRTDFSDFKTAVEEKLNMQMRWYFGGLMMVILTILFRGGG